MDDVRYGMDDVRYGMDDVRYDMEVSCQKNADVDDVRAFTGTFIRNPSRTSLLPLCSS